MRMRVRLLYTPPIGHGARSLIWKKVRSRQYPRYRCNLITVSHESFTLLENIHIIAPVMRCSICAGSFATVSMLLKHICLAHADRPDFSLQCNLQGCRRTFKRFTTFRNHIYQHHDVQAINIDDGENGDGGMAGGNGDDLTENDTPPFVFDGDESDDTEDNNTCEPKPRNYNIIIILCSLICSFTRRYYA